MATPNDTNYSLTDKLVTCHQVTGVTIPTAGANVTTTTTVAIAGANLGDLVLVSGPTVAVAHQAVVTGYVSAAGTVTIAGTADGTGFTGVSSTYNVEIHHKS